MEIGKGKWPLPKIERTECKHQHTPPTGQKSIRSINQNKSKKINQTNRLNQSSGKINHHPPVSSCSSCSLCMFRSLRACLRACAYKNSQIRKSNLFSRNEKIKTKIIESNPTQGTEPGARNLHHERVEVSQGGGDAKNISQLKTRESTPKTNQLKKTLNSTKQ